MSVVIGWLDDGTTTGDFTECVLRLGCYEVAQQRLATTLRIRSGPQMPEGRNKLVTQFLETEAEWLFMVDTDMIFTHDIVDRLLETADPMSAPVVAGLCFGVNEQFGQYPTMYENTDGHPTVMLTIPDGLVKVAATGAACVLTHRDVFMDYARDDPHTWFHRRWIRETEQHPGNWLGEDLSWYWHLTEQGVPVIVDTSISVGHIKPTVVDRRSYAPH